MVRFFLFAITMCSSVAHASEWRVAIFSEPDTSDAKPIPVEVLPLPSDTADIKWIHARAVALMSGLNPWLARERAITPPIKRFATFLGRVSDLTHLIWLDKNRETCQLVATANFQADVGAACPQNIHLGSDWDQWLSAHLRKQEERP